MNRAFTGAGLRGGPSITNQQRFELASGEAAPSTAANGLIFLYTSAEALVVTADSATAIADIGFPIEVRYEDDSIDTTDVARVVAAAQARPARSAVRGVRGRHDSRRRPARSARRGAVVDVSAV